MNFEIAKKLKDAGFKSELILLCPVCTPEERKFCSHATEDFKTAVLPTLEELGDALPDGFYSGRYKQMGTGTLSDLKSRYFAVYNPTFFEGEELPEIRAKGYTEQEARAILWLILNEKNDL